MTVKVLSAECSLNTYCRPGALSVNTLTITLAGSHFQLRDEETEFWKG